MPNQPPPERLDPGAPGARAALIQIKTLRQRLLDLSTRNKLISFKHNARSSKSFVRVIDADIQDLFEHLTSGKPLELVPLPHPPDEPPDEQTNEFRDALGNRQLRISMRMTNSKRGAGTAPIGNI